jgi:hypothetical protein
VDAVTPGWRRWSPMIEAEQAVQALSRKLVELGELGPGDTVTRRRARRIAVPTALRRDTAARSRATASRR